MSKIKAFCGVRFHGNNITQFICPPYDIISKNEKERLKRLSAENMVKLELPDEASGLNK